MLNKKSEKKIDKKVFYHTKVTTIISNGEIYSLTYKEAVVFRRYKEHDFSFFCHKVDEKEPFRITEETTGLYVVKGNSLHEVEEQFLTFIKEKSKKEILMKIIKFKKMTDGIKRIYV